MKMASIKSTQTLFELLSKIYHASPIQCISVFVLMLFKMLSSSFGLLMILPMLQWAGIPILNQQSQKIPPFLESVFQVLPNHLGLISVLVIFFAIQVLIALINFTQEYLQLHLKEKHIYKTENRIYYLLLHLKWIHIQTISQSSILQSLTKDINHLSQAFNHLMQFINQIILAFTFSIISLLVSFKMTLIAGACGLLTILILTPFHNKVTLSGERYLTSQKVLMNLFHEQLNAIKLIKSTNNEKVFLKNILSESKNCKHESNQFSLMYALSKSGYTIMSTLVLCMLIFGAVHYAKLSAGMLLFQLIIFAKIMPLITNAHQAYLRLLHLLPSLKSLNNLEMNCFQNQEHASHHHEKIIFNHAIQFKGVNFKYTPNDKRPIINNFSHTFLKKNLTVITGKSGVGKSTLLDILTGLVEPTSGDIFIDNQRINTKNLISWRSQIAYLNQNIFLFNQNIRDNLTILCHHKPGDEDLWEALRLAHADDFVSSFRLQLDTVVGERGEKLSGGQRQRIALARALLLKPNLLILDEPTTALDNLSRTKIKCALSAIKNDLTIIVVTHDDLLFDIADYTINLGQSHGEKKLENHLSPMPVTQHP